MWNYIEAGKREGAEAIIGGIKRSGKGYYVDPTSKHYYHTITSPLFVTKSLSIGISFHKYSIGHDNCGDLDTLAG